MFEFEVHSQIYLWPIIIGVSFLNVTWSDISYFGNVKKFPLLNVSIHSGKVLAVLNTKIINSLVKEQLQVAAGAKCNLYWDLKVKVLSSANGV